MGYMRHHSIVVTSHDRKSIDAAHSFAVEAFKPALASGGSEGGAMVTPILVAPVNEYYSFSVLTDGSKEGWDTSDRGDEGRAALIALLRRNPSIDFAEVQFGDDEKETIVCSHSDEVPRDRD